MVGEVRPGQLVTSSQGRDAGRYYLVVKSLDDKSVLVTDGEFHRVEKPKRKNLKHIKVWPMVSQEMQEKLATKSKLTNAEVLSYLANMLSSIQE